MGVKISRDIIDGFYMPSKSDVITPNANGATFDPTGMLDSPIVWNTDGSLTFNMTPTTSETNPNRGCGVVLPWRDDGGRIALRSPAASGHRIYFDTPPAGGTGLVGWAGMSNDIALARFGWSAFDWDGADPRARMGADAASTVTAAKVGLVDMRGSAIYGSGSTLADDSREVFRMASMNNADGTHNIADDHPSLINFDGQVYLVMGWFSHLGTGTHSVTMSPSGFMRQVPPGERL